MPRRAGRGTGFEGCLPSLEAYAARLRAMDDPPLVVDGAEAMGPDAPWLYAADRVHPSAEGAQALGALLAGALSRFQAVDRPPDYPGIVRPRSRP